MELIFDFAPLLVSMSIAFAAWMWFGVWMRRFPVPIWDVSRIFGIAFIFQLLIYVSFAFLLIDVQTRIYLVRTSIVVICLSQAIPLWIAERAWKHEQRTG